MARSGSNRGYHGFQEILEVAEMVSASKSLAAARSPTYGVFAGVIKGFW